MIDNISKDVPRFNGHLVGTKSKKIINLNSPFDTIDVLFFIMYSNFLSLELAKKTIYIISLVLPFLSLNFASSRWKGRHIVYEILNLQYFTYFHIFNFSMSVYFDWGFHKIKSSLRRLRIVLIKLGPIFICCANLSNITRHKHLKLKNKQTHSNYRIFKSYLLLKHSFMWFLDN